jgi:glycosyltransferase involved in cell wall biosynthesis
MNPLISIIIPTYNHAHFLGRALQSLLDQTYSNWEAIIIDNYSEDGTEYVNLALMANEDQEVSSSSNQVISTNINLTYTLCHTTLPSLLS